MDDIESLKSLVETISKLNATSTALSAIAAIFSAVAAWIAISKSTKNASVMMVLEIENQMNERKAAWNKAIMDLRNADIEGKSDDLKNVLIDYHNTTKETYFNSLDRLCFCILNDYLKDKNWRVEYRNLLNDTISEFEDDFGSGTPYKNALDLNNKWQRT